MPLFRQHIRGRIEGRMTVHLLLQCLVYSDGVVSLPQTFPSSDSIAALVSQRQELTQGEPRQQRETDWHKSVPSVCQQLQEGDCIGCAQRIHERLEHNPVHRPCPKPLAHLLKTFGCQILAPLLQCRSCLISSDYCPCAGETTRLSAQALQSTSGACALGVLKGTACQCITSAFSHFR